MRAGPAARDGGLLLAAGAVGDRVYVTSEQGRVLALRTAGEREVLGFTDFGSEICAAPALVEGRMYLRTKNGLYAIGAEK